MLRHAHHLLVSIFHTPTSHADNPSSSFLTTLSLSLYFSSADEHNWIPSFILVFHHSENYLFILILTHLLLSVDSFSPTDSFTHLLSLNITPHIISFVPSLPSVCSVLLSPLLLNLVCHEFSGSLRTQLLSSGEKDEDDDSHPPSSSSSVGSCSKCTRRMK